MAKVMPKEAVGPCLTVMDGGILPYGPFVAVAAMCCFHAFRDGLLARIPNSLETSSWFQLYQAASLDCCMAALIVLARVVWISLEPELSVKVICGQMSLASCILSILVWRILE